MIAWIKCLLFALCVSGEAPPPAAPAPVVTSEQVLIRQSLDLAAPLVARWEGVKTTAYLDRIASPPVWTICFGETEGVRQGEVRTLAECERGLKTGLVRYQTGLWRAYTPETRTTRLTPHRGAAFISLSWNIGVNAARNSTATRRLNAGDIRGSCVALTWFNKAGGRVIRGLQNRRADEHSYCIRGLV